MRYSLGYSRNSSSLTKPEYLLPRQQDYVNGPYPKPVQSPYSYTPHLMTQRGASEIENFMTQGIEAINEEV
jgi:hypothetical protein